MKRTDRIELRDPASGAVIASQWTLTDEAGQAAAAQSSLAAMPDTPGIVRYSVFRGLDAQTLFHLSQWRDEAARDHYVTAVAEQPRGAVDAEVQNITRDWREMALPYRSFVRENASPVTCLVVVRQPLIVPDQAAARDWIDIVFAALESTDGAAEGLCAANFFISTDGGVVLNCAEWTSADAHRAALKPADFGQNGSLGESAEWRATRSHPGIRPDHEVARYELVGSTEPGS